jgi:hypothetical protein
MLFVNVTLTEINPPRPSLLNKTQLEWLLGNKQLAGSYNGKIKESN